MSDDQDRQLSPRVNSAQLANYLGKNVRLACKVLNIDVTQIVVEASDGGQVNVQIQSHSEIDDTYIEVVGKVQTPDTIRALACIGMGSDLDMKLVNDTIILTHDPRFKTMFS
ncbi:replication factor A protein 3 [Crepidotus variabilis]|uniref:Replication factor A protein 3 n=1 Tax=Crepidotus variabilis TaxID=179855 RepID=A0A9P6ER13_9AGAR|nr:replication factor A protein 3 [Crepidotus variabilis]